MEKADLISIKGTFFIVLLEYPPKAQSSKEEYKNKIKSGNDTEEMSEGTIAETIILIMMNPFQAKLRKTKIKKTSYSPNVRYDCPNPANNAHI
jgi:hypothetical protein